MANPSEANDEGITALHNSICAGHFDVVKFLVEFGCDVNAADTDGWCVCLCFIFIKVCVQWFGRTVKEVYAISMCVMLNIDKYLRKT